MSSATDVEPSHPALRQLLYASGNFGKSLVWVAFDTVLFYYLTVIGGMSLIVAGAIIMTALVWDGFGDLLIGYWADRTGRQDFLRTLLVIGAPLCGVMFAALFYVAVAEPGWRIVAIALLCWMCRIGYSLCDVAHNAMLVTISTNERDASIVSGMRLIFSAAGTMAVGLAFKLCLAPATIDERQSAFMTYAALGGAAYTLTLLAASRAIATSRKAGGRVETLQLWPATKALMASTPYRGVCLIVTLQAGVTSLFMKGLPFIGAAFFGKAAWAGDAIIVLTIAQVTALPPLMLLSRWAVSTRVLLRGSHALMAVSLIALLLCAMHLPALSPVPLLGIGAGLSGMNMTVWAKLALIVRETILVDHNLHAFPVGLFLAILKCAGGLGSGVLAISLASSYSLSIEEAPIILAIAIGAPFMASLACIMLTRPARRTIRPRP